MVRLDVNAWSYERADFGVQFLLDIDKLYNLYLALSFSSEKTYWGIYAETRLTQHQQMHLGRLFDAAHELDIFLEVLDEDAAPKSGLDFPSHVC